MVSEQRIEREWTDGRIPWVDLIFCRFDFHPSKIPMPQNPFSLCIRMNRIDLA